MTSAERVAGIVGGSVVLGKEVRDGLDLVRSVRGGLPVAAALHVLDSGWLTTSELDRVVIARRTLANRRKVGTLTAEQSDRLLRVARVLANAEETFGSTEKARRWLRLSSQALGGECPLDLLDTDEGAREVDTLLGRISHGLGA